MTLSTDERRALAIIAALLVLASGARWLERPQQLLADVPAVDLERLEGESRAARPQSGPKPRGPITPPQKAMPQDRAPPGAPVAAPIDPNTASARELELLPGVGPALAARIVEERERARFTSVEDLQRVRGVGAALAQRMAAHLALPAAAPVPASARIPPLTPVRTAPSAPPEGGTETQPDINEISSEGLQKVPGVGPVLAARIIARRDVLGRYSSWEQVDSVAGVGPALLARLKEAVVLRR